MMLICMALGVIQAFAVQCEGKTLAGARCKREAAEGSKYCIGHADQRKKGITKGTSTRELDNGQCWATTLEGIRCKHKKDGVHDYCRQHAATIKVKNTPSQCRALTYEGKQCSRKPEEGYNYCPQHRK